MRERDAITKSKGKKRIKREGEQKVWDSGKSEQDSFTKIENRKWKKEEAAGGGIGLQGR